MQAQSYRRLGHTLGILFSISFVAFAGGCTPASIPTQTAEPSPAGNCFPTSIFTEADMRARVDCHPDAYKLEISEETVVLFAFPDPIMDWAGPVFIVHVPSVSEVVLGSDGALLHEDYKNLNGQQAIESVISDQELVDRILTRAREIEERSEP